MTAQHPAVTLQPAQPSSGPIKAKVSRDDWMMRGLILVIGLYLLITLAFPLYAMMSRSVEVYDFRFDAVTEPADQQRTVADRAHTHRCV